MVETMILCEVGDDVAPRTAVRRSARAACQRPSRETRVSVVLCSCVRSNNNGKLRYLWVVDPYSYWVKLVFLDHE